ncbi:uncharacterized protein LOC135843595 [Planococcus citri]|uniref:uncharacterized protein LOC135843595 n=1 Tax=Planococcus citri TaxID=170843 RepID=UPI0031F7F948
MSSVLGSNHIHTTAYYPQANGKVERWHRTLKAAVMTHQTTAWVDILPAVLLGLRSTINSKLEVSPAQLTFGTELRLPGDFIADTPELSNVPEFVKKLQSALQSVGKAFRRHGNTPIFVPKAVDTCTHVFLRVKTQRASLIPPYTRPHCVICSKDKVIEVEVNGKAILVSIDHLKPAYLAPVADTDQLRSQIKDTVKPEPAQHPEAEKSRLKRKVSFKGIYMR